MKMLLCFLLTGCGMTPLPTVYVKDPLKEEYFWFLQEAADHHHPLIPNAGIVEEGNLPTEVEPYQYEKDGEILTEYRMVSTMGLCQPRYIQDLKGTFIFKVTIRPRSHFASDEHYKATIAHELAHCIMGKSHNNKPCNLMNPYMGQKTINECGFNNLIDSIFEE